MKLAIVLNADRVSTELIEKLNNPELSAKYNLTYDVFIKKPTELEEVIRGLNHKTYNACIIGGGDGTVRAAVQILLEEELPIAIMPLGTFNFLAKTLNHPNDIDALLAMIKNNKTKKIDLGDVNNNVFINHAWIGFYYYILKAREKHKDIIGKSRVLKLLFAALNIFNVLPFYNLEMSANDQKACFRTCLVYIGNNEQRTNFLDFGNRDSLSSGLLSVSILNCQNRWELFKFMLSVLVTDVKNSKYITHFSIDNLMITSSQFNVINTVIDGELLKLENPLYYTVHKKQLTVFIV